MWQISLKHSWRVLATKLVWVKEKFLDFCSSSLGDCEDAGDMTEGTQEDKHVWSVFSFANVQLEVQMAHLCGNSH